MVRSNIPKRTVFQIKKCLKISNYLITKYVFLYVTTKYLQITLKRYNITHKSMLGVK